MASVETTLTGFFSLSENQTRYGSFDWQPIQVQKIYPSEYHLFATTKKCNRFDYLMVEHLNNNNSYNELFKRHKSLISYLEANSGIKVTKILDLVILYDTLSVERLKFNRYVLILLVNRLRSRFKVTKKCLRLLIPLHSDSIQYSKQTIKCVASDSIYFFLKFDLILFTIF